MAGMKHGTWCHIEIPAIDMDRASRFYGSVFGWKFTHIPEMNYTLYSAGDGEIGGGLMAPHPGVPPMMTNYINVDSIEESVAKIEAAGGKVLQPKFEVPHTGWISIVQDTEGNTFGLWKSMRPPVAAPEPPAKKLAAASTKKPAKKKPAAKKAPVKQTPAKKIGAKKKKGR